MLTKEDLIKAVDASIDDYPTIAALYRAGDPRIRQNVEAMATMLSMFSAQIETAQTEVFEKAREGTVLADAAFRGIVPRGKPTRARLKVVNSSDFDAPIESGRNLIDAEGRYWRVETSAIVPAQSEGVIEAAQIRYETIDHVVTENAPFYAIQIPESEEGEFISTVSLADEKGDFAYRDRYTNVMAGERIFHVEADDRQRIYARLGFENVVGVQPKKGQKISLIVGYTSGKIPLKFGSPFSFEYIFLNDGGNVDLSFETLLEEGENPISMSVLRELAKYPSVYRRNAVFLGEFGFLVRTHFPTAQFLSVWNETMEEQARGPSVDNVNALFVACLSETGDEKTQEETLEAVQPQEVKREEWTKTQQEIERVIKAADDSYRVRFFTPVIQKINITISARVPSSYLPSDVKAKIREAILTAYGKESAAAKRGQMRPLYRDIYSLLKRKIVALNDGDADLEVSITDSGTGLRPELWRFVDEKSLDVTVQAMNVVTHSWNG